jgi:peptidoglycan/LPS O-acetylase OafA/YrhL
LARTVPVAPFVPALDGLRGISAQVVCLAHAAALQLPVGSVPVALLGWLARVAVIVFFVISGYAIAVSAARIRRDHKGRFDLRIFAAHRVARIYPPYLACLALVWIVAALLPPEAQAARELPATGGPGLAEIFRALAFANGREDVVTRLNGPLWSLRLEVALYVLAACAGAMVDGRGMARALALVAGTALAIGLAWRLYFGLPAMLLFGAGAFAALARHAALLPRVSSDGAALVLIGSVALGAVPVVRYDLLDLSAFSWAGTLIQLGVGLATAVLIARLATGEGTIGRLLARARPLGAFAYTLYVVHVPLLLLGGAYLGLLDPAPASTSRIVATFALLAAVQATSVALARALERPAHFREWMGSVVARS